MTIRQQGGVFGRNPAFNDVTIDGAINAPTTGSTGLVISGGTQSGTANALAGELRLGGNPVYQGRIYYDYNTGDFFIENSYNNNNGEIVFRTKTNSTPVEVGRFNQNGLAFPSGKGIDFSATSGTGTSELFDDYEEGTWTPEYLGSTSDPTVTYDVQSGKYTKIGNVVFARFELGTDVVLGGSGDLRIGGLPYLCSGENSGKLGLAYSFGTSLGEAIYYISSSQTYFTINTTANSSTKAPVTSLALTANTNRMFAHVVYMTS